jgi:hypothetical protein
MKKRQFSKSLSVALPPEHFEQIKKITDDRQISMAEWVREAVDAALKTNQKKEVKFIEGSDR